MHEIIKNFVQIVGDSLEVIGVLVILIGFLIASVVALRRFIKNKNNNHQLFRFYRHALARSILIGLEFLVAGDIIRTVAGDLTLMGIATLGGIVLIRIVLGLTLEVELNERKSDNKKLPPFAGRI